MTRAERRAARFLNQGAADIAYPGRVQHVGRRCGWLRHCQAVSLRDAAYLRRRGDFRAARAELDIARRMRAEERSS